MRARGQRKSSTRGFRRAGSGRHVEWPAPTWVGDSGHPSSLGFVAGRLQFRSRYTADRQGMSEPHSRAEGITGRLPPPVPWRVGNDCADARRGACTDREPHCPRVSTSCGPSSVERERRATSTVCSPCSSSAKGSAVAPLPPRLGARRARCRSGCVGSRRAALPGCASSRRPEDGRGSRRRTLQRFARWSCAPVASVVIHLPPVDPHWHGGSPTGSAFAWGFGSVNVCSRHWPPSSEICR